MRLIFMHRFYCPQADLTSPEIVIDGRDEWHHLHNVLRLREGDVLQIFNAKKEEATGRIVKVARRQVRVGIESVRHYAPQPPLIILACAIPKRSKFESIVEKTTELGVDEIIPLETERTDIHLKGDQLKRKAARYQAVAVNAAQQSQRPEVPLIQPASGFMAALDRLSREAVVLIPSLMGERQNILKAFSTIPKPQKIAFLIGPEGDFTLQEYTLAREHKCLPVSLGETVLKVDTAAVISVACASLYYRYV
jgi:16S rRNA (uracil1498-N3)-methyltransferase